MRPRDLYRLSNISHKGYFFRFVGGELNACYNAVDRHVEAGKGSKIAIIHDSPLTATVRKISYAELLDQVRTSQNFKLSL